LEVKFWKRFNVKGKEKPSTFAGQWQRSKIKMQKCSFCRPYNFQPKCLTSFSCYNKVVLYVFRASASTAAKHFSRNYWETLELLDGVVHGNLKLSIHLTMINKNTWWKCSWLLGVNIPTTVKILVPKQWKMMLTVILGSKQR